MRPGPDYEAACKRATTDQGLDPVLAVLAEAGITAQSEQTGGFTMVVMVHAPDGAYLGITASESSPGRYTVCLYQTDNDGALLSESVGVDALATTCNQFLAGQRVGLPTLSEPDVAAKEVAEYRTAVARILEVAGITANGNWHSGGGIHGLRVELTNCDSLFSWLDGREYDDAWTRFDWSDSAGELVAGLEVQVRPMNASYVANGERVPCPAASPLDMALAIGKLLARLDEDEGARIDDEITNAFVACVVSDYDAQVRANRSPTTTRCATSQRAWTASTARSANCATPRTRTAGRRGTVRSQTVCGSGCILRSASTKRSCCARSTRSRA